MKKILLLIVNYLSRAMVFRYKPLVIGITGNVGKTSTKDAISSVLASRFSVRKSDKNFNNELGLPLTVLGIPSSGKNIIGWIISFIVVIIRLIYTQYPKILILEMGVDKPGDMDYLLKIIKPDIAVYTAIGEIPVHVENFTNRDQLIREKFKLASAVSAKGYVVFNADISLWGALPSKTKAKLVTYGMSDNTDIQLSTPEMRYSLDGDNQIPIGIACKVQYKGNTVPIRLDGILAQSGVYYAGAACAVGDIMGMNLVDIVSALNKFIPPESRLQLKEGINHSLIIDDTYNASPNSMLVAIDTLNQLKAKRKIIVLGDMLELGSFSEEAHRDIGRYITTDILKVYLIGNKVKYIEEEVIKKGFIKDINIFSFNTSKEVGDVLYKDTCEGDMILIKGSHSMHMDTIVKKMMIHHHNE